MKRMLKFSALALIVGLVLFSLAGCKDDEPGDDPDKGKEADTGSTVSFNNFSPPSIYVENKSRERLVAFKGSLNPSYLISGIPPNATNHGLAKTNSVNSSLFSTTGDFALILITEAEYNKNKNNPAAATVFAEIYAFYNNEATNNNVFSISSKAGGAGRIILQNPTPWNIEIHKDGPTGEVLGYVASQMLNTTLRLTANEDYNLFPVFKRYNPSDKEIYEIVPRYPDGGHELLVGKPFMQPFSLGETPQTWNFNELASKQNFSISSGGIYFRIENNAGVPVKFARGTEVMKTSTGRDGIQQTYTNLYSIKVTRNPDGTYPEKQTITGYSIGTDQLMLPITEREYKTDYIYTIRVTGSTAATINLGQVQESDKPMDLEAKFNMK